ncbi:type III-B CRISPR module RAMP protein Cmr6 [Thermoanaerobacterium thermosaccharolyticum]|uniref:type III-B CRISPR module RAMP protein Cmr6 n=1 Tax=Thermoanaerobacterium thermosaccharolyticum TaxID=1517 RepID=UPI0020A2D7E7|nr:type III-B CRISPR module RAMP protein Cmr6 [Thermoanaerobacterium thermosaccharolyticum]MCP2239478.1 CRISPR-associated protein Cmr6 [Thermoanaerobacterium thermosaccharolyticum]
MKQRKDTNYEFYNPLDTATLLTEEIQKISMYKGDSKEEKSFHYTSSGFTKNPALIFGKLIPHSFEIKDGTKKLKEDNKQEYLKLVINEIEKTSNEILYISARFKNLIKSLENCGYKVDNFHAAPSWRLVVGLGSSHSQETSMTLHHIYGIPYIPGSALKGVTKHWVILSRFNNDEQQALQNQKFREIFGTQENEGKIIFFDAYPCSEIKLKIDIMNPHYPQYYSGSEFPTDCQLPNPIKFLTVEKTDFNFCLATKHQELLSDALSWVREALTQHGIGAKTSVGYGFFEV